MTTGFYIQDFFFDILKTAFSGREEKILKILKGEDIKKFVLIESVTEELYMQNALQFHVQLYISSASFMPDVLQDQIEVIKNCFFANTDTNLVYNIRCLKNNIFSSAVNGFEARMEYVCFAFL